MAVSFKIDTPSHLCRTKAAFKLFLGEVIMEKLEFEEGVAVLVAHITGDVYAMKPLFFEDEFNHALFSKEILCPCKFGNVWERIRACSVLFH